MSSSNFLLNPEIKKVFIISPGRTGTEFLAKQLPFLCQNTFAIHEPDRLSLHPKQFGDSFYKIKNNGFYQSFIKKIRGKTGTRLLSILNTKKKIDSKEVYEWLYNDRKHLKFDENIYVESNWQLFGLNEHLIKLPNTTVIIIIRDSISWIKSWINRDHIFARYKKLDYLDLINKGGFIQTSPENLNAEIAFNWKNCSRIEKFIWLWSYLMQCFLKDSEQYKVDIYKYEDLFIHKHLEVWKSLTGLISNDCSYSKKKLKELLQTVINANDSESLGSFKEWNTKEKEFHKNYCKSLRLTLGYGI